MSGKRHGGIYRRYLRLRPSRDSGQRPAVIRETRIDADLLIKEEVSLVNRPGAVLTFPAAVLSRAVY